MNLARLKTEQLILNKYFSAQYSIEGNSFFIKLTSNKNNEYEIRIDCSDDYPIAAPKVYIQKPALVDKNDISLSKIGPSWQFHTGVPDSGGNIQISCSGNWENEITIYSQAIKALVWINAYEATFDTQYNINNLLENQQDFFTYIKNH